MKHRKLGNGGLEVSAIGFGCMGLNFAYGSALDKASAIALIRAAHDNGVTFFDTAEAYGPFTVAEAALERLRTDRIDLFYRTESILLFPWRMWQARSRSSSARVRSTISVCPSAVSVRRDGHRHTQRSGQAVSILR
ncbi:MAG: aldo/keto reductase [Steroidobacteraceae bacterium]|jgi:diketogulonate reductase-like aldo/keto reductase